MEFIANTLFPAISEATIAKMVAFNNQIDQEVMVKKEWGHKGGPWEFNLRDLFRWCQLMLEDQSVGNYDPSQHMFLVYGWRMRSKEDREQIASVFKEVFGQECSPYTGTRQFHITPHNVQVGYSVLARNADFDSSPARHLSLLHCSLQSLEPIMKCIQMGWMVILVGPAAAGKTSLIQLLALLTGHKLKQLAMNSAMDTTELLGGFEQADINRPWQQLLGHIGDVVTKLVRGSLLSSDASPDETETLLRSWSSLNLNHKPKFVGEGGRGITTDLLNKLESVLLLIQRQNAKLNIFSKSEFAGIVENFHSFKEQLLHSVEGRSSGTFEWVDGMLVNALQSGDWLLMDNVNFCSPSVLDRLNALLEPGGVLTMTERGVIDGSTPTIKPHPNFRLFLSMDPSHGEISRAMRNRGIELYISEENDSATMDSFDIKKLLHGLGLVSDDVCDALIAVHSDVKETVIGSPCGSQSSLLHAATLISQQLQRGIGLQKAFYRVCSEVFVNAQHTPANQKQIQEIVLNKISALENQPGGSLLSLGLWPNSVPSVLVSAEDSLMATVLRDGQILLYVLNRHSLRTSRVLPLTLQDLQQTGQSCSTDNLQFSSVELDSDWMDDLAVIPHSVQLVVEKATSSDWMLRMRWLSHLAKKLSPALDKLRMEIDAGAHTLGWLYSGSIPGEIGSLVKLLYAAFPYDYCVPLDPRWNMQFLDIVKHSLNFDKGADCKQLLLLLDSVANRAILLMNRKRNSYLETNEAQKLKQMSALKIAVDFHKDPGVHQDLPHPVVAHLAAFFDLCDVMVYECLETSHSTMTNEDADKILACLQWRDRFRAVSENVTLDSAGLALISLHWHWIVKHMLDHITRFFEGQAPQRLSQEVQSVSMHIQECLSASSGTPASIKLLQKVLGRPLPFKNDSVVRCMEKLKALSVSLDILDLRPVKEESKWHQDICRLKAACLGWDVKANILEGLGTVLQANQQEDFSTDKLSLCVDSQTACLGKFGVRLCSQSASKCEDSSLAQVEPEDLMQLSSRVQMWPGMDYLMLLWQYKVVTDLLSHSYYIRKNLKSDLAQLVTFCLKWTPTSSQNLRALWYLLQQPEVSSRDVTLCWSELLCSVFSSFWRSTVTTDPDYWSSWKPGSEEAQPSQTLMDPSVKGPGILSKAVLSKCFCEVLTSSSKAIPWDVNGLPVLLSSQVSLGEWNERMHQLQDISAALWCNMTVSSMANFGSTDSRLQGLILYHHFVALKDIVPQNIQEEFLQYCDHLPTKDLSAYHYIQDILGDWSNQGKLPENVLKLWSTCLQQFYAETEGTMLASEVAQRGSLWVNLGLLQIHLWLPQTRFDPASKREYKLKYAEEELHQLESEWKVRNQLCSLLTGKELDDQSLRKHVHPRIRTLLQKIQEMKKQILDLSKKQAYRPKSPTYDCLYKDVHHYLTTIAKTSSVQDFATRLLKAINGKGTKSRPSLQNLLSEEVSWQQSHHRFRKLLSEEYSLYPDVVTPLHAAILQMQHGMRLIASELYTTMNSALLPPTKITGLVASLVAFPSTSESFPTYFSYADTLCSVGSLDVLKGLKKLSQKYSTKDRHLGRDLSMCLTKEQLLVNSLLYLRSHVLSKGEMDPASLNLFRHICQAIINEWDEQERYAHEREKQESSLYKYRNKSHGTGFTEDEEEEKEFRQRFPLYEQDFADITAQPTLEEKMETEVKEVQEVAHATLVSQSSMQAVMSIHQQLCLNTARSLWYHQHTPPHQAKHYLSAFLSCYQTSSALIEHIYPIIGAELNDHLLGSQLLASTILQNTVSGKKSSNLVMQHESPYDFYQHPNIPQVQQCQGVLQSFIKQVNKLLEEWPEHPALLQIVVVIDRILKFPLSSPLAKFLNGLEILLAKSQDWEENTSRSMSLRKHLDEVTQLIIQWRKLELNCWSLSLDNAMLRHSQRSTKHWFSVYQLVEKYLQEGEEEESNEALTLQSLTKTLQEFVEGSTLGEFNTRLQVLLVFHCHVLLVPQAERKDSLCSVLWNLYNYYKQFLSSVQARITELRNPLEKELKDFVKISRWNDVSFWSVKQSVEKTHRTLFKYMKKFEVALNEPCCTALIERVQEERLDFVDSLGETQVKRDPIQQLKLVLMTTLTGAENTPLTCGQEIYSTESLQCRLPKLTKRMKKLCATFIKKSTMPISFENLNKFTDGIIDSVQELQKLTVDLSAEKEKQKSEAKHILMQKQRALAELFKMLTKAGLSYRKGLAWTRTKHLQDMLCLHPLDLHSALAISNSISETNSVLLSEISVTWEGCQKYFYRCLARNSRLEVTFATPAKELGLGTIDRCKGFAGHLLKVLMKQRISLTDVTEQWIIIRNLLSCMQEISSRVNLNDDYKIVFPPQDATQQWVDRLQHLSMQCTVVLEQLSWLLECCPLRGTSAPNMQQHAGMEAEGPKWAAELGFPSPVAAEWLPPACTMQRSDKDWEQLNSSITKMLTKIKATKASVDKIRQQSRETLYYSWKDFETCSSALDTMQHIAMDLREVESVFVLLNTDVKEAAQHMTFLKSIHYIREEVRTTMREFTLWRSRLQAIGRAKRKQESDEAYVKDFSEQVESTIKTVLCAIQKLAEKKSEGEKKTEDGGEEGEEEILQPGLITKLLTEDVCSDLKSLHVTNIISAVSELLERLKTYGEDCIKDKHTNFNQCCGLLARLWPMLSVYSDLILFYLTVSLAAHRSTGKLLSVLTRLFTELAQKGFCVPKELIEEQAGEGATEFHDYEGGGIGEGEGKKDVSNKIDNEDQVEDTLKKGEDKDKEDPDSKPDVKEEDNAIEMSDDFDGKLHDGELEKKEEDDEKSNSDEEDLDKQMGDLGDAEADKLDERLWGDDDDDSDDNEESESDKAEETGPGMDMGESELVAKDDNLDAGSKNKEDKKDQFKDEKDEEQPEDGTSKEKIHEQLDEREYDENEVDPYHGKQEAQQEPEALDLPDDLNLDNNEDKNSGDENEGEESEEKNPFDVDEKAMDIGDGEDTQTKEMEDTEGKPEEEKESDEPEKDASEDKAAGEEESGQEGENKEEPVQNEEGQNTEEATKDEEKEPLGENEERHLPMDKGVIPQNEEDDETHEDEEVPDSEQRMEHEACGQTAEDNVQSETAAELAGAASEKDQAKEDHGTGTADASQSEGHESNLMARLALQKQSVRNTQSFKRKPGQADDQRSMGDYSDQVHKRLRTMESSSDITDDSSKPEHMAENADAYEHIKDGAESYDAQTYDVASKDQEKTAQPSNEEVVENSPSKGEDMDIEPQEEEELKTINVEKLKPEEITSSASKNQGPENTDLENHGVTTEEARESTEESNARPEKDKAERSTDSTIHTALEFLKEAIIQVPDDPEELRRELEKQLEAWTMQPVGNAEEEKAAAEMWQRYVLLTGPLSQQLCEQLRLILEPTQAAKLKGDFRTGKRLNMRKVIPYIASQFRKDKIWLRRTKPSKRQYQICLAIDDSSSMVDNHSKQLAYESLAVIGNALTLLEVGQIAVYSFGENVKLLHPFHEQFSDHSGSRILSQCKFQQKKTLLAQFLESSVHMFTAAQQMSQSSGPEIAQLLIIVSDGRGLFVEGKERVTNSVQAVRNARIFTIFIILDNPTSKDSILDIKVPIFTEPKGMPKMISYMEQFPFPFYIILRDVNALPETLSDALRQWFELVTTSDHV